MKNLNSIVIVISFTLSLVACGEAFNGQAVCAGPDCIEQDEICNNGIDDDGDGRVDCKDLDCSSHPACQTPSREDQVPDLTVFESCSNNVDDDNDGLVDCDDPNCSDESVCRNGDPEDCSNGVDDDMDDLVDCDDPECYDDPACDDTPLHEANCTNGVDDDGDGEVDCEDADCEDHADCQITQPEICGNGRDDDGDGLVDFLDSDCGGGNSEQICNDGVDNSTDTDSYVDCYDHDCAGAHNCLPEGTVPSKPRIIMIPGTGTISGGCWGTESANTGYTSVCSGDLVMGNYRYGYDTSVSVDLRGEWSAAWRSGTCSPQTIMAADGEYHPAGFQLHCVSKDPAACANVKCFVGCALTEDGEQTRTNWACVRDSGNASIMALLESQGIFPNGNYSEIPLSQVVRYQGIPTF